MPSPPMSEVQSHRGASPCYDHSDPSSPSSHSSSRMQIDDNSARHVHGFGTDLDHQVESSKAGFLAETGRRTTVHFPHTLPASRPELLAPTPIRRSQSQELLNADYTNFKLDQSKQQQSKISQPQLNMGSTASNTHLPRTSVPKGPQVAREPNISHKTTRLARSYSNISPRVSNRSSANQSSRSSTLRQSWQSDELNANSSLARAPVDQDARITPPPAMQRSVSHSPLARSKVDCRSGISDLPSWSFPNRGQLDIFNGSSLTPQLGMPFSLPVDGNGSRRASLPELSNHSQTYVDWPSLSVRDTAWSRRLRADHVPTVPVPEVEMHDDSSDEGQEDQKYENNSTSVQISSTPKRSNSERTLRRLKSSPSGKSIPPIALYITSF